MTVSSIESAALLGHEAAVLSNLDALTKHRESPPFLYYFTGERFEICPLGPVRQNVAFSNKKKGVCQENYGEKIDFFSLSKI